MKRWRTRKWLTFESDAAVPLVILYKRTGDRAALSEITKLFREYGRSRARFFSGRRYSADDLFQEAFFGLTQAITKWDPMNGQPFTPFAWVKMRCAIQDFMRRERRVPQPLSDQLPGFEIEDPSEERVNVLLRQKLLREALRRFPSSRRVIELYLLGWERNEIGSLVGIPSGTVGSRWHRFARAVRTMLKEEGVQAYA